MTHNKSLGTQSIIDGPASIAPPDFDGMGWLVVINLAAMTAAFFFASALAANMVGELWKHRREDDWRHPVSLWRIGGLVIGVACTLRFGAQALILWGWDTTAPQQTAILLMIKRFVDPVAAMLLMGWVALFKLTERGMVEQLQKRPYPIDMWANLPMLKRPASIAALSLVAAAGVVTLR